MGDMGEVAAFLLGEGELDGVGFGDPHPTERGNYWWRKHLRAALAQQDHLAGKRKMVAQPEPEPVATLFGSLPVYDVPPAKPVAWVENLENARPHCVTDLKYCSVAQHERGEHLKYIPLYRAPPQREWQGLTDEEMFSLWVKCPAETEDRFAFARAIEAKLKEKNA